MIERVGKEFPTLFIFVRERVRPAPLEPKDGLVVGPAAASLRLSSALPRYRRARSLAFQALLIREASSAPQARFWTWGWSHTGLRKGIETKLKVSKTVRTQPHLHQKGELEEGPAAASLWLSSALRRY